MAFSNVWGLIYIYAFQEAARELTSLWNLRIWRLRDGSYRSVITYWHKTHYIQHVLGYQLPISVLCLCLPWVVPVLAAPTSLSCNCHLMNNNYKNATSPVLHGSHSFPAWWGKQQPAHRASKTGLRKHVCPRCFSHGQDMHCAPSYISRGTEVLPQHATPCIVHPLCLSEHAGDWSCTWWLLCLKTCQFPAAPSPPLADECWRVQVQRLLCSEPAGGARSAATMRPPAEACTLKAGPACFDRLFDTEEALASTDTND